MTLHSSFDLVCKLRQAGEFIYFNAVRRGQTDSICTAHHGASHVDVEVSRDGI